MKLLFGKVMRMGRYKKMEEEPIPFGNEDNPRAQVINPEYEQQSGNPRRCVECGKTHDTIVENTMTGERLEELSKCDDCMLFGSIQKLERPETPPSLKEWEDKIMREWMVSCSSSVQPEEEKPFDPFEEHWGCAEGK